VLPPANADGAVPNACRVPPALLPPTPPNPPLLKLLPLESVLLLPVLLLPLVKPLLLLPPLEPLEPPPKPLGLASAHGTLAVTASRSTSRAVLALRISQARVLM
jgi:hypothetical protein